MTAGRPSDYSKDIADKIVDRIADGESLRSICLDPDMPSRATVFRWLGVHEEFQDQYARAKEEQAELFIDELVEIADESQCVVKEKDGGMTEVAFDSTAVQRNKLRVETRKWAIMKLKPKKYSDRILNEHTGKDGGAITFANMTDDEIERRLVEALNTRPEN